MALKEFLILSRPRSGRVEGRTALIQFDYSFPPAYGRPARDETGATYLSPGAAGTEVGSCMVRKSPFYIGPGTPEHPGVRHGPGTRLGCADASPRPALLVQKSDGEISSRPVVVRSGRVRVAKRPPLMRAMAAIIRSGAVMGRPMTLVSKKIKAPVPD
jgi:hypothetical protein